MFNKKEFFIGNLKLDKYQSRCVVNDYKRFLVVAGAGSGKTLVIVSRVKYLIENLKVDSKKILCISFTNETVNSMINSFNKYDISVDVKTFHKLALDIISYKSRKKIASSNLLDFVLEEYFFSYIYIDGCYDLLKFYLRDNELSFDEFFSKYKNILLSFIKLFKSLGYLISNFINILFSRNINSDDKILLVFAFKVYVLYEEELSSNLMIDFDDILSLAIKKLDSFNFFKYKYIIIDEFQDTSFVKFSLIKKLIDRFDINLMAVGDDFQSIYSFTGCDINLFLNFKKNISRSKVVKLKYNYRNPKDIVDISKRFVLENRKQLRKNITSFKYIKDSIVVIYSNSYLNDVCRIIEPLDNVLILGRNNKDVEFLIDNINFSYENELIYLKDKNKNVRFLTVHASKGLEADYVIVLNVVNDCLGFPNMISDNELYKYLYLKKEDFLYSEERRLFYVALTRAKIRVFLLTKKGEESIFLLELLKKYKHKIKLIYFD